jgi:multicomponent Na+:H+ antiporter subunit D
VLAVLATSALLNAAYFFPILYRLWVRGGAAADRLRPRVGLATPPAVTAVAALATGGLAATAFSPLAWASLIVEGLRFP